MLRGLALAISLIGSAAFGQESVTTKLADTSASFQAPTTRYGHDVLGGLPEWGRLCLTHKGKGACVTLPTTSVFEDIAPRLIDVDGDGIGEAIVVESSVSGGASLVVYAITADGLSRRATPPIGTRNRWLAPIGIADLDADGHFEIAYVETPHLGKLLRIWRIIPDRLVDVAELAGFSNHAIGEPFITSDIRNCPDTQPEIIVPVADRGSVAVVRLNDGKIDARILGKITPQTPFEHYMTCPS